MHEIGIDIETYSSYDLASCGVYRYTEAKDFTILLFSYAVDGGPVQCCDFASGEKLPEAIIAALRDPNVTKTAFNAAFERVCISRYYKWQLMDPAQWRCTMVRAGRMGLPMSLDLCGEVLQLSEKKMKQGKALIRQFSMPDKLGRRCLPSYAPDKWDMFKRYNIRDVEVEQQILAIVRRMEPAPFDRELYIIDQRINDRGVMLDKQMAANAERFSREYKAMLVADAKKVSGLANPESPAQIKEYLDVVCGVKVASIDKRVLDSISDRIKGFPNAVRLLELRRKMAKTSNKKYTAMLDCVCNDGRIHGLLQFYGAVRTGRWAGRLVQVQNLPQNHLQNIDYARSLVKGGDLDDFLLKYDNPMQVLSELIRTAFVAKPGCTFHVCDFSAIEARVIAWLAGEDWVLDVFRRGGDIYCATASQMFGVPVEKHGQNAELRQKGKIAVLALGYGGGVAALEAMGGSRLGLTPDEEREIVDKWRQANPNIVRLWRNVETAAIRALEDEEPMTANRGIVFAREGGMLTITLPSGRKICYPSAKVGTEMTHGREKASLEYKGLYQMPKRETGEDNDTPRVFTPWSVLRTYGGKLTENIVQAIARDILGWVILRAEKRGLKVVFHVHDEVIVEATPDQSLQDVERLFSAPINWCKDLPLKGAGYSTPYYLKD